jgi:hypothetical protein
VPANSIPAITSILWTRLIDINYNKKWKKPASLPSITTLLASTIIPLKIDASHAVLPTATKEYQQT